MESSTTKTRLRPDEVRRNDAISNPRTPPSERPRRIPTSKSSTSMINIAWPSSSMAAELTNGVLPRRGSSLRTTKSCSPINWSTTKPHGLSMSPSTTTFTTLELFESGVCDNPNSSLARNNPIDRSSSSNVNLPSMLFKESEFTFTIRSMRASGNAYPSPPTITVTARITLSVMGSDKINSEPWPGWDSKRTVPPISRTV